MRILCTFLFAAMLVGCSGTTPYDNIPTNSAVTTVPSPEPTTSTEVADNTPPPGKLFKISPDGPVMRITKEGYGDDQIRANIAGIDKSITYALLKKNADRYSGQRYAATGKIIQISEKGDQTLALVGYSVSGKVFLVTANFPTKFVEGDQVYAVGYLNGDYNYKSIAGWDLTVPEIVARAIIKQKDLAKYKSPKK